MIYSVIFLIAIICTIVTLFLIKESFSSRRRNFFILMSILSICLTLFASSYTVFISFKEKEKELTTKTSELQNDINKLKQELQYSQEKLDKYQNILGDLSENSLVENNTNQPIKNFFAFDNVSCNTISRNFNDTEINNINTEFVFYNHPENLNVLNTLTFSFMLDKKYNFFSTCISVTDNIIVDSTQATSIQIFADENLIYSSENFYNSSMPLYLNLNLNNVTKLSFSINTNMIDTDEDIFRTVSFSETKFE